MPLWYSATYVDEGVYVYIGRHMGLQQMPYLNLPDNKGPVVYFFYRALFEIFGLNTIAWRLVFLGIILASGWAFYRILRRRADAGGAWLGAGLFWALMLFDQEGGLGLLAFRVTETIGLFFLLWSLDWLQGLNESKTNDKPARNGRQERGAGIFQNASVVSAGAGLLLALALLTNSLTWPAVLGWGWLHYKKEIRITPAFLLAAAAPLAVFGLVLLATGSLGAWWTWTVVYNFANGAVFSNGGPAQLLGALILSVKQYLFVGLALLPLLWKPARKHAPLALAFLVLAIAPEIHQISHVTEHYDIMIVPTYLLGLVAWYDACKGFDRQVVAGIIIASGLLLAAYFTALNVSQMGDYARERSYMARMASQTELINNSHVWAPYIFQSSLYAITNASYPGRHFFDFWLFNEIPWIRTEIVDEFASLDARGQVQYVVVADVPIEKMKNEPACWSEMKFLPDPIMRAIFDHYDCRPLNYTDGYGQNLTLCRRSPLQTGGNNS